MRKTILVAAVAAMAFSAASAMAGPTPEQKCQADKLKTAGKYESCRLNAEAKAVKKGVAPDYTKCKSKFSDKWQNSEAKAGAGVCPSEDDEGSVEQFVTRHAGAVADGLSGALLIDPYAPATGQTPSYGAGDDGDVQSGAALDYQDNGDGTITDMNTGLMWEKKVRFDDTYGSLVNCVDETGTCKNPHNGNNAYLWTVNSAPYTAYDGAVVTIFLEQLNNRCDQDRTVSCTVDTDCAGPGGPCGFAGHRDWRLPSYKELIGIVDYNIPYPGPTVNAAFDGGSCGLACTDITDPACSCTTPDVYRSASTYAGNPEYEWDVSFSDGTTYAGAKNAGGFVRAVRGGS